MEANPLEVQTQIIHNSNTIRNALKDLHEWEGDVKRLEKQRKAENEVRKSGCIATDTNQCYLFTIFLDFFFILLSKFTLTMSRIIFAAIRNLFVVIL